MFGKSKKKQEAAAAQQMQVSPEALALLQAMQAQQLQAQQLQAQQLQAQQLQAQQLQAQQLQAQQLQAQQLQAQMPQMPDQQPVMPQAQMPTVSDQDLLAELGGAMPDMAQSQQMPQQPAVAPQMPPQIPPQIPSPSPQTMVAAPLATTGFPFDTTSAATAAPLAETPAEKKKKGKLTKDEKRILSEQKKAEKERKKAEKKAQLLEKAEEKKRAKRRKKLAKTRFSRARYLREANGNAIAGASLWTFMIIAFIVGPFLLNTAILIPQTNENMRVLSEAENLKRSIVVNRPKITVMADRRKQKNNQINAFASSFVPRAEAAKSLEDLALQLEQAGLEVTPIAISNAALTAQSIVGTSATFSVNGSYLDWLRIRNKFVRSQTAISIPIETMAINDETGQMEITAQIILPSRP